MGNKNIKILVSAHKQYRMPEEDIYLPLHVGAEGKNDLGYTKDNTGDNISSKNPYYCELTGLYWAWKNLDFDYLGVAHYRRHFYLKKKGDKWQSLLTSSQAQELCDNFDIILPSKRRYFIESLYSHYAHTFDGKHLDIAENIIEEQFPDILPYFKNTMKQTSGYMFNMFIMNKELINEYCTFLFKVLLNMECKIDYKNLSAFESRLFGRVSELLFNVWLNYKKDTDKNIRIKQIHSIHMEPINWWKKGMSFLKAKFCNKKYTKSF